MKILYIALGIIIISTIILLTFIPNNTGDIKMKDYNIGDYELATFAGGCFWCMEGPFESEIGVIDVIAGYTGGTDDNPTYEEVSAGGTGHIESIQIVYDSSKISYEELVNIFWRQIDPTDDGGQFVDRGDQYVSAIFYHNGQQKILAEISIKDLNNSGVFDKPIVTQIREYDKFYAAENYHQDYYKKNPLRYKFYRSNSGRDDFLNKIWVQPKEEELKEKLTPIQFDVTQNDGTEPAFDNEYWNEIRDGIYVDVVSGEPLFSSIDKYDSETGWPSFTKPLEPENIVEKTDRKFFVKRTEIRSKQSDSHLGHVFNDGPKNSTGLRYCMNSAALRFIAKEDLQKEGYCEYEYLFN